MDIRKFIVNRDYARRLYVPRDNRRRLYNVQMRKITDKQIDNQVRYPHSESKKPYRDEEYPLMEYEWSPFEWWWPTWPTWPDIPPIANLPDVPGSWTQQNPDKKPPPEGSRFLGCEFYWPLTPGTINPGETAYAKLMRRDDPIVAWAVQGPIKIIQENAINCHSNFNGGPSSPECTVIVQALEDTTGYGADASGCALGVIIAYTASNESCSTSVCVKLCPADPELEYDWDTSDETITPPGTGDAIIIGGLPPYSWEISSEDGKWSLANATTTGPVNQVIAEAGACGGADITITDACGDQTTGSMRNPSSGSWVNICTGGSECWFICGAPDTSWSSVGFNIFEASKTQGKYKQIDQFRGWCGLSIGVCGSAGYSDSECLTRPGDLVGLSTPADPCIAGFGALIEKVNPGFYQSADNGGGNCCMACTLTPFAGIAYQEWQC